MKKGLLLPLLVFSVFTSAFRIDVSIGGANANVNLTQLLALVIGFALVIKGFVKGRVIPLAYRDWPSFFIYAYLGSNIFSSLFFASNQSKAFKSCMAVAVYVNIYHIGRWFIETAQLEYKAVKLLKQSNMISAVFGMAAMVTSLIFGGWENIGVSLGHVGEGVPSIRSLSFEPNVFAIITSVVLCLSIAKYLIGTQPEKGSFSILVFLVICVIFSYTRSAYASLTLVVLLMLKMTDHINLRTVGYLIFTGAFLFILGQSLSDSNFLKEAFMSKAANMANFTEGNGLGRVTTFLVGWAGFIAHPVFGNGTMTADTGDLNVFTGEIQDVMGTPGWLSGSLIQSLHDTGIIGALIILGIFISLSSANYKLYKEETKPWKRSVLLGFFTGNIVIGITSQLTSIFWVSFPFLYWAINMAFITKIKKEQVELITPKEIIN